MICYMHLDDKSDPRLNSLRMDEENFRVFYKNDFETNREIRRKLIKKEKHAIL